MKTVLAHVHPTAAQRMRTMTTDRLDTFTGTSELDDKYKTTTETSTIHTRST